MKKIKLSNGKEAIVDDDCFEFLSRFTWHENASGYVVTNRGTKHNQYSSVRMHRLVIAAPQRFEVDHRNGNTLDNRMCNLRFCTRSQNNHNKAPIKTNGKFTSKYRGVKMNKNGKTWTARIWFNRKAVELGTFPSEIEAHQAVIDGSKKYYGEFSPYYMRMKYD